MRMDLERLYGQSAAWGTERVLHHPARRCCRGQFVRRGVCLRRAREEAHPCRASIDITRVIFRKGRTLEARYPHGRVARQASMETRGQELFWRGQLCRILE